MPTEHKSRAGDWIQLRLINLVDGSNKPILELRQPLERKRLKSDIAVVIAFYNKLGFLSKALESVSKQTIKPHEVIVVDDGSDLSLRTSLQEVCLSYGARLVIKTNGGQASARNMGVLSTKCRLIAFLDQDDCMLPNHLQTLQAAFAGTGTSNNVGFAYGRVYTINMDGNVVSEAFRPRIDFSQGVNSAKSLSKNLNILPSALMVTREAFIRIEGFDEMLRGYEDDDLIVRLNQIGYRGIFVDTPVAQWVINAESSSNQETMNSSKLYFYRKWVMESAQSNFPGSSSKTIKVLNRRFALAFISSLLTSELGSNRRYSLAASQLKTFSEISPKNSVSRWLAFLSLWTLKASVIRLISNLVTTIYGISPKIFPQAVRKVFSRYFH